MRYFLRNVSVLLFFLVTQWIHAQLSEFNLTVTATNETCTGNGLISMTTSGLQAGANVSFAIYLLPNTTTPIAVLTNTVLTGLSAGSYRVVATQTLNGQSGSQQQDVVIGNEIETLTFSITPRPEICGTDGSLQINILSGNASSYEIISGPVTLAPQASNVLTGLVAGQYQIRVFDICGNAVVQTFTLSQGQSSINVGNLILGQDIFPSCDLITITNAFSSGPGAVLAYPLSVEVVVFSPTGQNVGQFSETVASGASTNTTVSLSIPYFTQSYDYQITVTDACGNTQTATRSVQVVLQMALSSTTVGCNNSKITVSGNFYNESFTLEFLSSPAGFNPTVFNFNHPGPFDLDVVYESNSQILPEGVYVIQMTDACGRTVQSSVLVEVNIPPPTAFIPCDASSILVQSADSNPIVSLILTSAPSQYPINLPQDLTSSLNSGSYFTENNVFTGTYTFQAVDSCGASHVVTAEVSSYTSLITFSQRPGCDIGFGSLRVSSSAELTSINLIQAPALFPFELPYDLSGNIMGGFSGFNFGMVPAGLYVFQTTDACGGTRTDQVNVVGYAETSNNLNLIENCGSFDLQIQHTSNGVFSQAFWLQKWDTNTNSWVHPFTNVPYNEGTAPTTTNSFSLTLNVLNLNFNVSGNFRVLKSFQTYNISGNLFVCTSVLHEFVYSSVPQIINVETYGCSDGTLDAQVNAIGVPTLTYKITTKNGAPFLVDNSDSSLFLGLEPAVYNFQVEDSCGNIVNAIIEITPVLPLEITSTVVCDGQNGSLSVIEYPFLTYQWFASSNPQLILSQTNQLDFSPYSQGLQSGEYGVIISSPNPNSCINQTLFFTLNIDNSLPDAGNDVQISQCYQTETLDLFSLFTTPFETTGVWTAVSQTDALNGSNLDLSLLTAGIFEFQYTVSLDCNLSSQSTVTIEVFPIPTAPFIEAPNVLCEGTVLNLTTPTVLNAQYFWSGPNEFSSTDQNPVISNVGVMNSGVYELFLEINGCVSAVQSVAVSVQSLPEFELSGDGFVCQGVASDWVLIPANFSINQATVRWFFQNEVIAVNTDFISVDLPGAYELVVDFNGCETRQSFVVSEAVFDPSLALAVRCVNDRRIISWDNALEYPTLTFQWTGPNNFSSTEVSVDITGFPTGDYQLTVTNDLGCVFEQILTVDRTICMIPKGVSPGNDLYNDTFDLSEYEVDLLKIFNRYGTQVFEKKQYTNEWVGQTHDGKTLPSATYFYYIEFRDGNVKTGWVYLQRE